MMLPSAMDLGQDLSTAFSLHASRAAASMTGRELTYGDLWERSGELAQLCGELPEAPVGILAGKGFSALAAFLACVRGRRPYLPLNPKFPDERLREIIRRSRCAAVAADEASTPRVRGLLDGLARDAVPHQGIGRGETRLSLYRLEGREEANGPPAGAAFAYLMFTSGSTGYPKGIAISRKNLEAYLSHATSAFGMEPGSRASQLFDFSFDLSVHDLFVTWLCGGELCLPGPGDMLAPGKYVERHRLTHWFSVPSVAVIMGRLGLLRVGAFPSIRQSLFCGEALSEETAARWAAAVPNSTVWNLYGPTEATIAFTAFKWNADAPRDTSGTVPIGQPFPGQQVRINLDRNGDGPGELYLGGSQVAAGYLDAAESGAPSAFGELPGELDSGFAWYRTGDLVERDDSDILHFRGRVDSQVQIMGHRVELAEVEAALRLESAGAAVAAVAVPGESGNLVEIIGFVESSNLDPDDVRRGCQNRLPAYMAPKRVIPLSSFPLNANGKIDRNALKSLCHE